MSTPWMKFYPTDWRADPALRMCSVGARGLWMEILCLMHEAEPYGSLRINGNEITPRQIASLAGTSPSEVEEWLSELEVAGVFSRDDSGVIISRRMQRDKAKAESDKANGKRGGNPGLKEGVNPPVKSEDKAQKPEAIAISDTGVSEEKRASARRSSADFDQFWSIYPNRVGKRDAEKAFLKAMRRANVETILAGLRLYAAKTDDRPWCNPATWLNQDRWDDAPAAPPPRQANAPPPNDLSRMNAALDSLISGQPNEPDLYPRTIDASFERRDRGGSEGAVQRPAIPARN